jgi:hypothetical protein
MTAQSDTVRRLQCLQLAHVSSDSHDSNVCFMPQHGNSNHSDTGTFSGFHGCNKCITVVFKTWLAKIVDYCKTN